MAGYLSIAAKLVINVHDLNNEGSVGQSLDIRQIRMVDEQGNALEEMPAVSGRMMKHWHLEHMLREELGRDSSRLCDQCKVCEPERKPQDENNGVNACIICDAHGFLCTDKPGFSATVEMSGNDIVLKKDAKNDEAEERINVMPCVHKSQDDNCPTCALRNLNGKKAKVTGELNEEEGAKSIKISYIQSGSGKNKLEKGVSPKGLSLRRSSCVNFSWMLPVLGTKPESKQVIHSRVASGAGEGEEKSSQMIFHKSYASGVYAFVSSIELGRIGAPLKGDAIADDNELQRRRKLAVQALLPLCLGAFGASQSHALPHTKCLGLLAALSATKKPVPNLISPIYPKGFEESIALLNSLKDDVEWWCYGEDFKPLPNDADRKTGGKFRNTVQEVFDEILNKI